MSVQIKSAITSALNRMNGNLVAVRENDATFLQNISQMLNCSAEDDVELAEVQMRNSLCAAYGMSPSTSNKPFAFSGGYAIIPIHGSLINRYGGYYYGYVTGYNFIRSQRNAALNDPDVLGIIYDVNSGGGEAAGCFELAQEMFDTRDVKPSLAVVDSNCYSAAYALASAAGSIALTPSGGAGSIGVISMHVDMSKMLDDIGIKITLIKSGDHKADGSPYEPLSDEVKAGWQKDVDAMRADFVNLVAQNRGLDAKVVHDTQAMCYNANDALALGLVDAVATPQQSVAAFITGETNSESTGANAMTYTQEQMDAAVNTARAEASTEATTAERSRVSGILGCEAAKNRQTQAAHLAFKTSMSVDDASGLMLASAEEVPVAAAAAAAPTKPEAKADPSPFNAAMDGANHPNAGADTVAAEPGSEQAQTDGLMAAMSSVAGADALNA
ncbi:head maturation protease [Hafnia phage Enc34]|uniref:Prohead protease n=1 Tax=Hafnia phage Enc34 TaxID=1150990 RepID=H6WYH0_9CAUD|nr:head maturation protease [Hafnia phage Enc34]AFB84028.1 prohead protease [Hafnia phage Enc34]